MKGYCSIPDVKLALSPLTDPDGTASTLTDPQLVDAINEAEGIIDGYIASRYVITPVEISDDTDPQNILIFLVAPDPVRGWCRNIAAYLAALTYRKNKDLGEDDPIRLRYNLTMALLLDVRSNKMNISLPGVGTDSSNEVAVINLYEGRLFGPEDFNLTHTGYQRIIRRDV